jgi:hypothetical protein
MRFVPTRLSGWIGDSRLRHRAIRWTRYEIIGALTMWVGAEVGGRIGLLAKILAPNSASAMAAGLVGIVLLVVRFLVIVVGPPALTYAWIRTLRTVTTTTTS